MADATPVATLRPRWIGWAAAVGRILDGGAAP